MVSASGLERLESSRMASLGWVERAQPHREMGLGFFSQAQAPERTAEDKPPFLVRAGEEFTAALTLAPIDPQALAMLLAVRMEQGELDEARRVMDTAHAIAPVSPEFAMIRGWLAMRLWPNLSADEQAHALVDFRMAFRTLPRPFTDLVVRAGFVEEVRSALAAGEEEQADAFERALDRAYVYPRPSTPMR